MRVSAYTRHVVSGAAITLALYGPTGGPTLACAQEGPAYAQPGPTAITGTIISVDGGYGIHVRGLAAEVDVVDLGIRTAYYPPRVVLTRGEVVTIHGHLEGNRFVADEIDAPYFRYRAQMRRCQRLRTCIAPPFIKP